MKQNEFLQMIHKRSMIAVENCQENPRKSYQSPVYLGKRKIIFKMPFLGDILVSWRVLELISIQKN